MTSKLDEIMKHKKKETRAAAHAREEAEDAKEEAASDAKGKASVEAIIHKLDELLAELKGHTAQDNSNEIALLEDIRADLTEL